MIDNGTISLSAVHEVCDFVRTSEDLFPELNAQLRLDEETAEAGIIEDSNEEVLVTPNATPQRIPSAQPELSEESNETLNFNIVDDHSEEEEELPVEGVPWESEEPLFNGLHERQREDAQSQWNPWQSGLRPNEFNDDDRREQDPQYSDFNLGNGCQMEELQSENCTPRNAEPRSGDYNPDNAWEEELQEESFMGDQWERGERQHSGELSNEEEEQSQQTFLTQSEFGDRSNFHFGDSDGEVHSVRKDVCSTSGTSSCNSSESVFPFNIVLSRHSKTFDFNPVDSQTNCTVNEETFFLQGIIGKASSKKNKQF